LWLDADDTAVAPCSMLTGGCAVRPHSSGPLRSMELSVVWYTPSPGPSDLGVCHYEGHSAIDDTDLSLYCERRFSVRLPDGPLSPDVTAVAIRWPVRARLRYVNGDEIVCEFPFHLCNISASPARQCSDVPTDSVPLADVPDPPSRVEVIETPQGVR